MKIIWALLVKDWKGFWGDRMAVMLTFLVPGFIIFLIGNIMGISPKKVNGSGPGPSGIHLAVVDETDSAITKAMIVALEEDEAFRVIRSRKVGEEDIALTEQNVRDGIKNNRYRFALVFPEDTFSGAIGFKVKLFQNPRNMIETQTTEGLLQKNLMMAYFENIWDLPFLKADPELVKEWVDPMVDLITEFWDVPEEEVRSMFREDSFMPDFKKMITEMTESEGEEGADGDEESDSPNLFGQMMNIEKEQLVGAEIKNSMGVQVVGGYSVMFLLFTLTGMASSLFEEKQAGIFLRLLSSPVTRAHILLSKYVFGIFMGMVQLLTMFVASWLMFRVDIFYNFGNLFVTLLFVSAACTGFGMLIASISKTPAQANGIGTLVIISMSAIGGAWFPVSFMAESVQVFSRLTVVYWSMEAIMRVMFEGKAVFQILPVLGILALIAAVVISFSLWRFKTGDLF